MEPRLLLLETSGRIGQVGLAAGGRLLAGRRLSESSRHARDLAPTVADLFREFAWAPADVQGVAVSRGPGSYTGLRVGVMTAKAFAYATGCRLLALDTFAAIARQAPPEADVVDVLADAQKRHLYAQRFRRTAGGWRAEGDLAIRPAAQWLPSAAPWVSGPGVAVVEAELPAGVRAVPPDRREPGLDSLLQLATARWASGAADDVWALEPRYARASSAELNWPPKADRPPPP
jgi:tRNA threonylcarbamoyladenosine biosynthesis protein TsaB